MSWVTAFGHSVKYHGTYSNYSGILADPWGMPTPKGVRKPIILQNFAKNCMKMKEFRSRVNAILAPPWVQHCSNKVLFPG